MSKIYSNQIIYGDLSVQTGSTVNLLVKTDGHVGIGEPNPTATLSVKSIGFDGSNNIFQLTNGSSVDLFQVDTLGQIGIGIPIEFGKTLTLSQNSKIFFKDIGNSNPSHIQTDVAQGLNIENSGGGTLAINSNSTVADLSGTYGNDLRIAGDLLAGNGLGIYLKARENTTANWRTGIKYVNSVSEPDLLLVPDGFGNIGVNTSSPSAKVQVVSDSISTNYGLKIQNNSLTDLFTIRNDAYIGAGNTSLNNLTIGFGSGWNTSTTNNTLVGLFIAPSISGNYNTMFGAGVASVATSAQRNVGIGTGALSSLTIGFGNIGIGFGGGQGISDNSNEIAIGNKALETVHTGTNIAIGSATGSFDGALFSLTAGTNTVVGTAVGAFMTTSTDNTLMGHLVMARNVMGNRNTAMGHSAGQFAIAAASDNVYIGYSAGEANNDTGTGSGTVGGDRNVFIGSLAGQSSTSNDSVFIGYGAGQTETNNDKFIVANNTNTLLYGDFSTIQLGIGTSSPIATLDIRGSAFVDGDVNITGNVNIIGTATTINTQTLQTADNNILLNYSGTTLSAIGGGITVLSGQPNTVNTNLITDIDGNWNSNVGMIIFGTSSDSSAYGLKVKNSGGTDNFVVRNDGIIQTGRYFQYLTTPSSQLDFDANGGPELFGTTISAVRSTTEVDVITASDHYIKLFNSGRNINMRGDTLDFYQSANDVGSVFNITKNVISVTQQDTVSYLYSQSGNTYFGVGTKYPTTTLQVSGTTKTDSLNLNILPQSGGTTDDILVRSSDGTVKKITASIPNLLKSSFGFTIDGGGITPFTGDKGFTYIPYDGTITGWYIVGDVSGSTVIDIKRNGTSIIGTGNKPTLSSIQRANALVSGWTSTSIVTNDELEFVLDSADTLTRVNLVVLITKS